MKRQSACARHWPSALGIGPALAQREGKEIAERGDRGKTSKQPSALGAGLCSARQAAEVVWATIMPSALGIGPERIRAVTLPLAALCRTPQQVRRLSPPSSPQTPRSVEERVSMTLADLFPEASEAAAAPATCPPSEWRGRTSRRGSTTKCHR